jgi:hypothetical protein
VTLNFIPAGPNDKSTQLRGLALAVVIALVSAYNSKDDDSQPCNFLLVTKMGIAAMMFSWKTIIAAMMMTTTRGFAFR